MDLHRHLRSLALLIFILATYFSTALARHHPVRHRHNRHKRQHHHSNATYLTGSFVMSGTAGELESGTWGPWSEPSECSRSCGGGVASQTRQCRDIRSDGSIQCTGGNKRYFSCNIQDCPDGSADYRAEQCAEFNKVPFEGRNYEWVPYNKAPNKCELNCMPRRERFYYRHKRKVVDGTRCDEEKLDICVEGQCLTVGCDMMLGSIAREDKCRECRGDGSSCRTVKDVLEMDDMQVGYNDILLIPAGATNIKVEEIRASNNYLAIRNVSNHYYLNGNWRIDFPRSLKFAGTIFHYERKPHAFLAPETITALGPTTEAIYIVFLYQEKNPGVAYEYSIHRGVSQPDEPDSYSWIYDEFSECSVTCGGGQQSRNVTCVRRKNLDVVANNLCNPVLEPKRNQSCNTDPCPPQWSVGEWGACSETCGDGGTQIRQIYCERVVSSGLPSVVEDEQCSDVLGPKPTTVQKCKEDMPCPSWHIGPWKPCDRLCGDGKQRRRVRCFRRVDDKIEVLGDSSCSVDKPEEEKYCMLRPCEGVDWVLSEWSGCDDKCGLTHETRRAHCANQAGKVYLDSRCHQYRLPELTRECENYEGCDSEWFASQWSECSADCGTGIKTRKVFCGSFDGEAVKKTDNSKCNPKKMYMSIENCTGKAECPGQWYSGPWSPCTKKCGGGDMSRKVLCYMENQSVDASKCDSSLFPFLSSSCNEHPCSGDQIMTIEPSHQVSEDEECEDEDEGEGTFITLEPTLGLDEIGVTADSTDEVGSGEMETTPPGRVTETGHKYHVDHSSSSYISSESMSSSSSFESHDLTTKSTLLDVSAESNIRTVSLEDLMLSDSTDFFTNAESTLITALSSTDDTFSIDDITESTTLLDDISSMLVDLTSSSSSESSTNEETSSSSPIVSTTESDISSTAVPELSTTETDIDNTTTEYSTSSDLSSTAETIYSTITSETESSTITSSVDGISTVATDSASVSTISGGTSESDVTTESSSISKSETTMSSSTEYITEPTIDSSSVSSSTEETISSPSSESTMESIEDGTSESSSIFTSTTSTEKSSPSTLLTTEVTTAPYEAPSEVDDISSEDIVDDVETHVTVIATSTITTEPSSTPTESSTTQTSITGSIEISESTSETTTETETEETTDVSDTTTMSETEETTEVTDSTTVSETEETTTEIIETTDTTDITDETESTSVHTSEETDESTEGTTEMTTAGSVAISSEDSAETTSPSESTSSETTEQSTSSPDISTEEFSSTTWGESTTAPLDILTTTPSPAQVAVTKEQKVRKCRPKKKPKKPLLTCSDSKFGCCADGVTEAQGPFSKGCPQPETCADTKFGCCADDVSPALGPNGEGCPPSLCEETLFGCCPDKVSVAEGNDFEGCKDDVVPFDCSETQFGCCPDNLTKASGPNLEGCFECEGSGDCESCNETKYGCCPDELRAASGENYTGCDEFEGSGFMMVSSTTEEAEDCVVSTFGCCPDGFTSAEGQYFAGCGIINKDNCTLSYFGCCPDGTSPALGPEFTGCHMPCEDDIYGCCEDKITPAHGPNREGCCLNTPFGCCPDNILAAQGSKLEGCGCQYTPYGCCPDNSTAARGPNAEGCGCQFTPNGCCPNRYTPAAGPNFQGCPCYTYQFGCCPDGISVAKGPRSQGCGCENTEFGCCSDDRTPASGLEQAGCSCESSKHGCCPDGISEARGDKFEGCVNVPIIPAEACTEKRERGPCRDFTVKWFFDMEYGGCSRFWYGGCGGNNNRFKSQDECKNTCVEPQGRDACYLPKIAGPCEGYYPTWYYDTERKQCGQFIYGGCLGNNNKFQTKEECDELCVLPDTIDACEQSRQEGPCKGNYTRWFYDKEEHMCQRFTYGGCKGNANNFATESACHQQCLQPGKSRDSCALPRAQGNCTELLPRWFFDASENRCMPFYYSGCEGNTNRFETQKACEKDCPAKVEQDVCTLPALVGECHNYTERWYYNAYEVRCTLFYYGGCGGNHNNFFTMQDCQQRCESGYGTPQPIVEFKRESCFLPNEHGPCSGSTAQWYYDSQDGVCKQFLYGGCQGNANRFSSQQECESKCENVQELCNLPRVVGPCNGNYQQWHYDRTTDECHEFDYGGCQGNGNRFNDRWQCEERCKKTLSTAGPDVSTLMLTTQDPYSNEIQPTSICSTPVDAGPCHDTHNAWFYNERTDRCEAFVYGGCGGNANRFESAEQCERQCGAFKGQDVCNIPYDVGHCRALFPKWYYDASSRVCREFNYGGCEGNGNRFSSIEECESICLRREEILPTGNDTTLSHRAICRLRVDSGPCPGGHYKRWYFDEDRLTCIPFIYTGCAGNLNRFKNFQTCLSFCSVLLREANDTESRLPETPPEIPEDYCRQAREECYQLHCPYGVERSVNEHNCEVCGCHDPCRGSTCPEGSNCAVDLHRNPSTGNTEFRAICRTVNKPGDCPRQVNITGKCSQECQSDSDCIGDFKCCFTGCGSSCIHPTLPDVMQLTTAGPAIYPPVQSGAEEPPRFDSTESEVVAEQGSYATLQCVARGHPTPTISWRKGQVQIDGAGGRHKLLLDGSLQVIGLHRKDSGIYTCSAENGVGPPVHKDFSLHVTEPTRRPAEIIGEDSTFVVVTLGASTTLQCLAVGWPTPLVTWWRGERMLPLSSEVFEQRRDFSLVIRSMTLRNLGPYTCQAYNGLGRAASWTVTVQAIGPVYTVNPQDSNYTKYLIAPPKKPDPPISPYRPIRPVHPVQPQRPRPAVILPPEPEVVAATEVPPLVPEPAATRRPPPIYEVPVQTKINLEKIVYPVGSDISIPCDVAGHPIPSVQWYKEDLPVESSERIQITESHRITILRADKTDAGTYKCEANNAYGSSSSSVTILVEGVFIHPNCTDNPFFANCRLIVAAKYCTHKYYARFCCMSCTQAGQLPSHGPHLDITGTHSKHTSKRK